MSHARPHRSLPLLPILAIGLVTLSLTGPRESAQAQSPGARGDPLAGLSAEDLTRGSRIFQGHCVRCHGVGGVGGVGPSLDRSYLRRAPNNDALISVIRNGIPGTGMPGAWQLSENEALQVAGYVRSLGRREEEDLPGDPDRGRILFERKGGCTACHIVDGRGGTLGPELTRVGERRGAEYLWESLLDPGARLPKGVIPFYPTGYAEYLPVRIVTGDGHEVEGYRVNEDAFTIQVRDATGRYHSFRKGKLRKIEKRFGDSLMPAYGDILTESELASLVAYLATLRGER